MLIQLTSTAFAEGQPIPAQHTCNGAKVSLPRWDAHLPNTQSLTLIADDPDAPIHTWVYWVIIQHPGQWDPIATGYAAPSRLAQWQIEKSALRTDC